jgi:peptidyl-prolyl cis-trans isomerase A (cyclophilin A)
MTSPLLKLIAAFLIIFPVAGMATVVRMQTAFGVIDIKLFDSTAPLTVANFLSYVDSSAYNRSLIHRSVSGFIIQGGGYTWNDTLKGVKTITANPPVVNEFSPSRSNLRGTIAMAKLSGDPNSATSQWFFNLADNSANLDSQNGGFTVFGQVLAKGMSVVDAIAALPTTNAGNAFTQLPLASPSTGVPLQEFNLAIITAVSSNHSATVSDSDRLFAYLEAVYPEYLSPANPLSPAIPVSSTSGNYYYRYYSSTNSYIAAANGSLYYLGPASQNQITSLGSLSEWTAKAFAEGY